MKYFYASLLFAGFFCGSSATSLAQENNLAKRQQYLKELLPVINPSRKGTTPVNFRDETWTDWQKRTGELPPDFSSMPSLPLLPDPLILEEGIKNIPVKTKEQWEEKRTWIKKEVQHWLAGTIPPKPTNLTSKILESRIENGVKVEIVEVRFGPEQKAKITFELMTPPGTGPFPVYMTQWNHRGWAQVALRRGYIACVYAGADSKDDTENYDEIYPDYDFTTLMQRAWGASRVVDYLVALPQVNKNQIAIAGHSRNGKQALLAGVFDDRIAAVISSSAGTFGEIPFRYTDESHDTESIDKITTNFPHWVHPRLRFFIGREHKLPIDQNYLMAAIAPRSLLLTTATTESQGDPWGIEQSYLSVQKVYNFLGAPGKVALRTRLGLHGTHARDTEAFVDFLDIQFSRKKLPWTNYLSYNYTFDKWKQLSGENISLDNYAPVAPGKNLLADAKNKKIKTTAEFDKQKAQIRKNITWLLGEEPAGVKSNTPTALNKPGTTDFISGFLEMPNVKNGKVVPFGPYSAPGDYLNGYFYYPTNKEGKTVTKVNGKMPVVIFLHEFSHPNGFGKSIGPFFDGLLAQGFAVFALDMIGFGSRIDEGTLFYERYPKWSKMGKMVTDTRAAIDAMQNLEQVDKSNIFLAGYSLGGSVGLFTAALDDRVAGLAALSAFTPLRTSNNEVEGAYAYSHLHGLLPRLGFFNEQRNRIPVDFEEIIATIAPKPLLLISPTLDRHADLNQVKNSVQKVMPVFNLYKSPQALNFQSPTDITRLNTARQNEIISWLKGQVK